MSHKQVLKQCFYEETSRKESKFQNQTFLLEYPNTCSIDSMIEEVIKLKPKTYSILQVILDDELTSLIAFLHYSQKTSIRKLRQFYIHAVPIYLDRSHKIMFFSKYFNNTIIHKSKQTNLKSDSELDRLFFIKHNIIKYWIVNQDTNVNEVEQQIQYNDSSKFDSAQKKEQQEPIERVPESVNNLHYPQLSNSQIYQMKLLGNLKQKLLSQSYSFENIFIYKDLIQLHKTTQTKQIFVDPKNSSKNPEILENLHAMSQTILDHLSRNNKQEDKLSELLKEAIKKVQKQF